jgi:hypothetical protein
MNDQRGAGVTSQGTAAGRFQRAIERGNLFQADLAARELGRLSLGQALAISRLMSEEGDHRAERACLRWFSRMLVESKLSTFAEAQLLLAAVFGSQTDAMGWSLVETLAVRHGVLL